MSKSTEVKYLEAVNNRCSISGNSQCKNCKAIIAAIDYVNSLKADNRKQDQRIEELELTIVRARDGIDSLLYITDNKPSRKDFMAIRETLTQDCDIIPQRIRQLEELRDSVQIGCNPPKSCNDPQVLKKVMKACYEMAMSID